MTLEYHRPAIVQQVFLRHNGTGATITLPGAPTPGNLMLYMAMGGAGNYASIPAGFEPLGAAFGLTSGSGNPPVPNSNAARHQSGHASIRRVQSGDGAGYAFTLGSAERTNVALFELDGGDFFDFQSFYLDSLNPFEFSPRSSLLRATRFVFVEQEDTGTLAFDSLTGLTSLNVYDDANNHGGILGTIDDDTFTGNVTGTVSGASSLGMAMIVSVLARGP